MKKRTPSRIVEKVWSAHEAEDLADFALPPKAWLLDIQRNGAEGQWSTSATSLGTAHEALPGLSLEYELQLLSEAVRPNGAFYVEVKDLPEQLKAYMLTDGIDRIQIIPISVLCAARSYLLLPGLVHYHYPFESHFALLGALAEECLFEELENRYEPAYLHALANTEALLKDYAQAISDWLCPYECLCNGISLFRKADHRSAQDTLRLTLEQGELEFRIAAHGYPMPNTPDNVHELPLLKLRKLKLKDRLTSFFRFLHRHWQHLRADRPLESIVNRLKELHDNHASLQDELDAAIAKIKMANAATTPPNKPFAFFKTHTGRWKVFLQGQECDMAFSYKQGMEMLQILLSLPDERIEPDAMYDLLKGIGATYNTRKADATKDPELDKSNYQSLKDDFEIFMHTWEQAKDKEVGYLKQEEAETIALLKTTADLMLKHRFQPKLVGLRTNIKHKLDEYALHRGLDMGYSNHFNQALKDNEPSGNTKNRLDSQSKGLKSAIDAFEPYFPKLYHYLNETIIRTKKDGRKTGHLPFTFVPSLAEEENLRNIYWETDDEG